LIIGGTGQVGAAVVRALAAEPSCAEVVMVNRRAISLSADPCARQVVLDTAGAQFPAEVTKLAQSMVAQGDPVYGASCVGVGKGSLKWSEEELKALEIGVVGGFARGCQAGGITQFSVMWQYRVVTNPPSSFPSSTPPSAPPAAINWMACKISSGSVTISGSP
jgi:hypothetical protein